MIDRTELLVRICEKWWAANPPTPGGAAVDLRKAAMAADILLDAVDDPLVLPLDPPCMFTWRSEGSLHLCCLRRGEQHGENHLSAIGGIGGSCPVDASDWREGPPICSFMWSISGMPIVGPRTVRCNRVLAVTDRHDGLHRHTERSVDYTHACTHRDFTEGSFRP
jgi:hypothetical protein